MPKIATTTETAADAEDVIAAAARVADFISALTRATGARRDAYLTAARLLDIARTEIDRLTAT